MGLFGKRKATIKAELYMTDLDVGDSEGGTILIGELLWYVCYEVTLYFGNHVLILDEIWGFKGTSICKLTVK